MAALSPVAGSLQIDATLGGGGHARRILEATSPDGRLLGLDADRAAIARARDAAGRLRRASRRCARPTSRSWATVAAETGFEPARTACSSTSACPPTSSPTPSAASASAPPARSTCASTPRADSPPRRSSNELERARAARRLPPVRRGTQRSRIARAIVERRRQAPIETAADLAAVVEQAAPAPLRGRRRVHPATRVFQALRIDVNRELETLPRALEAAVDVAAAGGRLAVISYHSLEDRIVKRFIAAERRGCICPPELPVCVCGRSPRLAPMGKQPQRPSAAEVARNPRSRSALCCARRGGSPHERAKQLGAARTTAVASTTSASAAPDSTSLRGCLRPRASAGGGELGADRLRRPDFELEPPADAA